MTPRKRDRVWNFFENCALVLVGIMTVFWIAVVALYYTGVI